MTLAFLGERSPDQISIVRRAMEAAPMEPLLLRFEHTGCFRREDGELWWLGAAKNEALAHIQKELSLRLREEGFPLENRRFVPHLTLGREIRLRRKGGQPPFTAPSG